MSESFKSFDLIANSYAKYRQSYPISLIKWLLSITQPTTVWRWLDVGCGTGLFTHALAPYSGIMVGCDLSVPMLQKYLMSDREYNEFLIQGDATNLPFNDHSFEAVSFAMSLHHLQLPNALQEAKRVCQKGGYIIVISDNPQKGVWHAELSPRIKIAESRRPQQFPTTGGMRKLLFKQGLQNICIHNFSVSTNYTVTQYIEMLSNKPFSTSFFLTDQEWQLACQELEKVLFKRYESNSFLDVTVYSCAIGRCY